MKKYFYKFGIHIFRIYWFIFRPTTAGVKCIIENANHEILFIRNTYGKQNWNFPGGKIEKRESPEEAVRREVKEELNITLNEIVKIKSFISNLEYKKDHIYVFHAKVLDDKFVIDSEEILEAEWFPVSNPPYPISKIAQLALD